MVEAGQIIDPQQQQITGCGLFAGDQLAAQAHVEAAPVGQAGEAVLVGFAGQVLAVLRRLGEQAAQLFHHLVHRQYHTTQFGRAR
ncbi:hypothetical protein D3C71_1978260 [compost metagenome]